MNVIDYGWNDYFSSKWNENATESMFPGRIIADFGQLLKVVTDKGEMLVGRPLNKGEDFLQLAVGDWVGLETDAYGDTLVKILLPRKTKFSRAAAGIEIKEQIVAANADTVFITQSLNKDFNMKRLERYMIAAWDSGAVPVVVLTKADCCEDINEKICMVYDTAPGVEVLAVSAVTGQGMNEIRKYLAPGKTVALLGSSGVGKSTLVNTLLGEEILKTQEIREDDSKGRHTTTHRELVLLPGGGLLLDTPGMRALSIWEADTGMELMFGDIEELALKCRFYDCKHQNEPGCAIRQGIEAGALEKKRYESWQKLQKELAHLEAKKDGKLRQQERQFGRQIAKFQKELVKGKYR